MNTTRPNRFLATLSVTALLVTGCQCRRDVDRVRPELSQTKNTNKNAIAPASQPALDQGNEIELAPTTQPAATSQPTSAPTSQPAPEAPEFVRVLKMDNADDASRVTAVVSEKRNELALKTTNVRRLRILRQDLELNRGKSIVLRLDGQTFEWPASSSVTTFECSRNGVWSPVRD